MIRRPPTTIGLTADDLAIFEKQYASGEIYTHHQPDMNSSEKTKRATRQDGATPGSLKDSGGTQAAEDVDADADAGEVREGDRGQQTPAQLAEEERKARTRDQRILGSTSDVTSAAGLGGITNADDESGVAGSGAQIAQQQQQQQTQR